jgi:hypothetical protein
VVDQCSAPEDASATQARTSYSFDDHKSKVGRSVILQASSQCGSMHDATQRLTKLLDTCGGGGANGCAQDCRDLFENDYVPCLRSYQPFVVLDGMKNQTIRDIVAGCTNKQRCTDTVIA